MAPALDRRGFTRGVVILAGGMFLGSRSSVAGARVSYAEVAAKTWAPLSANPGTRELIRYATLAANSHNSQPWLFDVQDKRITIKPDLSRRCPAVDPDDHHLYASLGCAAENLVLAAAASGQAAVCALDGDDIKVDLSPAHASRSPLFDAIQKRQCTRALYDGRQANNDMLRQLEVAGREEGVSMAIVTDRIKMSKIAELVVEANTAQMRDTAFMDELKSWMRFNETEAVDTMDGLFAAASGNPTLPRWIARPLLNLSFTESAEAKKYRAQIESSAGIAVLSSDKNDKAHWVAVGRACQRFALQATALGLKYAFINQPVEVPGLRKEFASLLSLGERRADIVMRFGFGPELPRSLRRPPEAVMRDTV